MLSNSELDDIISWLPNGCGWRIHDINGFKKKALPKYFEHGNYNTFQTAKNRWGFKTITHNQYYHKMFLRDNKSFITQMRCRKRKKTAKSVDKSVKRSILQQQFFDHKKPVPMKGITPTMRQYNLIRMNVNDVKEQTIRAHSDLFVKEGVEASTKTLTISGREKTMRKQSEMFAKKQQQLMDDQKEDVHAPQKIIATCTQQEDEKRMERSRLIQSQNQQLLKQMVEFKNEIHRLKMARRERLIQEQGELFKSIKNEKLCTKKSGKSYTSNATIAMEDLFL